ncbi:hypothetical protein QAD02_019883 [Eretmocerus hayati]|uniref:Uncharacterized protein n=1 Tax=Eretmocerus hayati TaxID=131215 RepID=A0ACC2PM22_9HYME|nr:hypothetical protein QAD02_019883 [Eretmocerus hayati]
MRQSSRGRDIMTVQNVIDTKSANPESKINIFAVTEDDIREMDKLRPVRLKPVPNTTKIHQIIWRSLQKHELYSTYLSCNQCENNPPCSHYALKPSHISINLEVPRGPKRKLQRSINLEVPNGPAEKTLKRSNNLEVSSGPKRRLKNCGDVKELRCVTKRKMKKKEAIESKKRVCIEKATEEFVILTLLDEVLLFDTNKCLVNVYDAKDLVLNGFNILLYTFS